MSTHQVLFEDVTNSEATAQKLIGSDDFGVWGVIKNAYIQRTAGTGTQFKVRYYLGFTGTLTDRFLTACTLPSVADDWEGTNEATESADPPFAYDTRLNSYAAGWTGGAPRAGLGVYITVERLDAAGNNDITTETDLARR